MGCEKMRDEEQDSKDRHHKIKNDDNGSEPEKLTMYDQQGELTEEEFIELVLANMNLFHMSLKSYRSDLLLCKYSPSKSVFVKRVHTMNMLLVDSCPFSHESQVTL